MADPNRIYLAKATTLGSDPDWDFGSYPTFDPLLVGAFWVLGGSLYVWYLGIYEIDKTDGTLMTPLLVVTGSDYTSIPHEAFIA